MKARAAAVALAACIGTFLLFAYLSKTNVNGKNHEDLHGRGPDFQKQMRFIPVEAHSDSDEGTGRFSLADAPDEGRGQPANLQVWVTNIGDEPIANAEVFAWSGTEAALLGRSDPEGRVRVLARSDLELLIVRAGGYQTERVDLRDPTSTAMEVHIRLREGGRLMGRVRWVDGSPLAGARVLAWRAGYRPSLDEVRIIREGVPPRRECALAETDPDGSFEMYALTPEAVYEVTAASAGGICVKREQAKPGGVVELALTPAYAARVTAREDNNGFRLDPLLICLSQWSYEGDDDYEFVPTKKALIELQLVVTKPVQGESTGFTEIAVLTGRDRKDRVGPIIYTVEVPGLEPVWTSFDALAVAPSIPEYILGVEGTGICRGTLQLNVIGAALQPEDERTYGELKLEDALQRTVSVRVTGEACHRPVSIEGLPCGEYQARLHFQDWKSVHPPLDLAPATVKITPEREARLDLDLQGLGAAEIRLSDGFGKPYLGSARFFLTQERETGGRLPYIGSWCHFEEAPYTLPALPPGLYNLKIDAIESSQEAPLVPLVILEGQTTAQDVLYR